MTREPRRRGTEILGFLVCLVALRLMIPEDGRAAPASVSAPDVRVMDAWIRWLPADIPAAGYMTLVNTGDADRLLVAVTSPDYGAIGMHQSLDDHGISRMRPVDSITLKPHRSFRFSEGGYHLMLMQPNHPLHPGDKVVMTLRFQNGAPIEAVFEVRAGG